MHSLRRILFAGLVAGVWLALPAAPTYAHEARHVAGFGFVVGWGTEPTFAGFPNSVQLLLHDQNERPVNNLGDALQVEVTSGPQKRTFALEPAFEVGEFGTEGDYRSYFIPTAPGRYSFRFFGSIRGTRVDTSFTAGPKTFAEIESPDQIQFPQKVPGGAELAARLDRELPRMDAKIAAAAKTANDDASTARLFGMIGTGLGTIGLILGGAALTRRR